MRAFKEFLLDTGNLEDQTIYMPCGSEVVGLAKSGDLVKIIALVYYTGAEASPDIRSFRVCLSDEIFYAGTVKYIGSFDGPLGLRHVIETTALKLKGVL